MTNEEVRDRLDIIITKHEIDDENVTITNEKDYDAIRVAIKALEQQTCEDAVSRQVVLENIKELKKSPWFNDDINGVRIIRKEAVEIVEDLCIKNLPSVNPQPKWIPVSEKLPEDSYAVLVWCPERKNIYCAYLEKEQWWIFGAFVQIVPNEVVAWMPLPEPYEPQERSDKE